MKNNRGVTLIILIITIIILTILTFTISVNIEQYENQKIKANFEKDMQSLNEEINQYYARNKELPIIQKFENTSMLKDIRNVNDNDTYYIIDIKRLDVKLNYGTDYDIVSKKEITEKIVDLYDVYIINEQSHTIYYPKGIEYNGEIHYKLLEVYSKIN